MRKTGLEPVQCELHAPQTCASASSATSAYKTPLFYYSKKVSERYIGARPSSSAHSKQSLQSRCFAPSVCVPPLPHIKHLCFITRRRSPRFSLASLPRTFDIIHYRDRFVNTFFENFLNFFCYLKKLFLKRIFKAGVRGRKPFLNKLSPHIISFIDQSNSLNPAVSVTGSEKTMGCAPSA